MRPSPAHTRTRTLQERLGIQQNGSSGVRSIGRLAEEVITDLRQNGDEENEEDDYFNELSSPEIIKRDDFCDNDYDVDYDIDDDEVPVANPSAERQFGDDGELPELCARAARISVNGSQHGPQDQVTIVRGHPG